MIGVILQYFDEVVEVRVDGINIYFRTGTNKEIFSTIDGLRIDYSGVIKDHPDLKDDPEWRSKAVARFKEKIKGFKTEDDRINYIVEDLRRHGYIPRFKQRQGHRVEAIK